MLSIYSHASLRNPHKFLRSAYCYYRLSSLFLHWRYNTVLVLAPSIDSGGFITVDFSGMRLLAPRPTPSLEDQGTTIRLALVTLPGAYAPTSIKAGLHATFYLQSRMIMPDGSDKTLGVDGRFDVLHELNEVWGPHKRRTSWSVVFKPLLSTHSRGRRERCAYFFFLNLSAHNEIIIISSASSTVFLERLSKRLSESMSSVVACFASVLSVKRALSCKTEDKTLRVHQP
jgi:hypothetical protein